MKILLITFLIPTLLFAQIGKSFKIAGTSNFYSNKNLFLQAGVFSKIYNYNALNFSNNKSDSSNNSYKKVQFKNKQFTINGVLEYPHPIIISHYDTKNNIGYNSNFFFVDGSTTNIVINDLSNNKNLGSQLISKSNKEYQKLKKLYSKSIDKITGEIKNLNTKQKTIKRYIIQNPNSFVALWDIVIDYAINNIYKKDSDKRSLLKIVEIFSSNIKKTNTYQALVKNINQDLELTEGKMFVNIQLNNANQYLKLSGGEVFPNISLNNVDSLIPVIKNNKFTLVDFWFSYCKPCIEQFPHYKKIYEYNKSRHFEIIGISVDRKEDEENWLNTIKKYNLNWIQYLDKNEIVTRQLNITNFPTNYLLDTNGKILVKNIAPADLVIFLEKNLN